jgi:hypothetical protein
MPSWNLTIGLGSNEEGQKRREAYEKAAKKKKLDLSVWAKMYLDAAAGMKAVKED